jgi:hypothetical protein
VSNLSAFPELTGERAIDKEYGDVCTIIAVFPNNNAVVEYDDEPGVPVSVQTDPIFGAPRFRLLGERRTVTFNEAGHYTIGAPA